MDAYFVPTADFHESEYVGEHFACRKYITGFTGSAGVALITKDWAGLWTDGRYFVQAAGELKDSGVELMKMGQPGVPTVEQYLEEHMPERGVLGFDGRVINSKTGESLQERLSRKQASICSEHDLIGEIWSDRPALSAEPVWILDAKYTGESAAERLAKVREKMKENGVKIPIVEESLMHMIYTGFFSSVFQIIEHDIDRETAKKNVHQLKEFNTGGWERLWNIEFPV